MSDQKISVSWEIPEGKRKREDVFMSPWKRSDGSLWPLYLRLGDNIPDDFQHLFKNCAYMDQINFPQVDRNENIRCKITYHLTEGGTSSVFETCLFRYSMHILAVFPASNKSFSRVSCEIFFKNFIPADLALENLSSNEVQVNFRECCFKFLSSKDRFPPIPFDPKEMVKVSEKLKFLVERSNNNAVVLDFTGPTIFAVYHYIDCVHSLRNRNQIFQLSKTDDVQEILEAARMLQLDGLAALCEERIGVNQRKLELKEGDGTKILEALKTLELDGAKKQKTGKALSATVFKLVSTKDNSIHTCEKEDLNKASPFFKDLLETKNEADFEFTGHTLEAVIHHIECLGSRKGKSEVSEFSETDDVVEILQAAKMMKLYGGGATADLWKESYTNINYLNTTVFFLDDNMALQQLTLHTAVFPYKEKTGENIHKFIQNGLSTAGVNPSKLHFVTDCGSNMLAAVRRFSNPNVMCACHRIQTVVENSFTAKNLEQEVIPKLLNAVKGLVAYFKRADLNSLLNTTLKQQAETRWLSLAILGQSVLKNEEEVKEILIQENQNERFSDVDFDLLHDIVEVLSPFSEAMLELQADSKPTLHKVAPWWKVLQESVKARGDDTEVIADLKSSLRKFLREKSPLQNIHYVALRLSPWKKKLSSYPEEIRASSMEALKELIGEETTNFGMEVEREERAPERDPKKSRIDEFDDPVADSNELSELELYLQEPQPAKYVTLPDGSQKEFGICDYWREKKEHYPVLYSLARKVLSVPASNAASERAFSSAGFTVNEKRTALSPDTIDALMFNRSWLKFKQRTKEGSDSSSDQK